MDIASVLFQGKLSLGHEEIVTFGTSRMILSEPGIWNHDVMNDMNGVFRAIEFATS